ncbi:MAG: HEAT repeat domain-containing protein [Proteobacteria bacterium]|jgi:hypothetical protein|nr:HEAT repeat domain-containing protein [Pseudomonadota bacterium]
MAKEKAGMRIEIIPDVYTLGLFKRTLSSRKRLRVTTLIAVLCTWLLFWLLSQFLLYMSVWPTVNVILIISLLGIVLFTAYLVALTIGDIIFLGPWREKMQQGNRFVPATVEEESLLLKNKPFYFILLWFAAIIGMFFVSDLVSGRVVSWYSSVGSLLTSMRSTSVEDRRSALNILTNPLKEKAWNDAALREQLVKVLGDEDPEVSALASYVSGRAQVVEAAQPLMEIAKNGALNEHVRAEAVTALGRIDWKPARGELLKIMDETFLNDSQNKEMIPAIIYAFYEMNDSLAIQPVINILEECLEKKCSDEIYQYGFFYLKLRNATQGAATALKYIDRQNIPLKTRCLAADSLRFIAESGYVSDMKIRFDRTPREDACEDVYRKYHQEAAVMLFEHDPMRALFVRAIGNLMLKSKDVRKRQADYDWIWVIGSDEKENPYTRKVAEIYTRAMNEKK